MVRFLCIDIFPRNMTPLITPAKIFQIMKPGIAAFYTSCFILPIQFFYGILLLKLFFMKMHIINENLI